MNKIEDFYYRNKNKLIVGLSLLCIGAVGFSVYTVTHTNVDKIIDSKIESNVRIADYVLDCNVNGTINLLSVNSGITVDSVELADSGDNANFLYSQTNNFEKMYSFNTSTKEMFEIYINEDKIVENKLCDINNNLVMSEYVVDNNYIYIFDTTRTSVEKYDIKNDSLEIINLEGYADCYVIKDGYLVYSYEDKIYSLNTSDKSIKNITVGDKTTGISISDGSIISFNKFGSGKNTSIILKINPSDLYIESMNKLDNSNVISIKNDSDDETIFIEEISKDSQGKDVFILDSISFEGKKDIEVAKGRSENSLEKNIIDKTNSISMKGYVYTIRESDKEKVLTITNGYNQNVIKDININGNKVLPVIK